MKRTGYCGIVDKVINQYTVKANVQVGEVELTLPFPAKVMKKHRINYVGANFIWYPTKDGSLTSENIKPNNVPPTPDEELQKGLEYLCNAKEIWFTKAKRAYENGRLPTDRKYHLFRLALEKKDYLLANRLREDEDHLLRKMITPEERREVHAGIKKGFRTGRYTYN